MNRADQWGIEAGIAGIPLTAALGFYLLPVPFFGFYLFGFRLLIGVLLAYLLLRKQPMVLNCGRESALFFRLGLAWVSWGMLAVLWSALFWKFSIGSGLSEITSVAAGFLYAIVLLNLVVGLPRGMDALRVGWSLAFVVTGLVAVWEILSGGHLAGYATDNMTVEPAIYSTFANPNNYAAFLALAFPFLVWSFRLAKGFQRVAFLLLCLCLSVLVVMTLGRLGLLALVIEWCLLIGLNVKWSSWRVIVVPVGLATVILLVAQYDLILAKFLSIPFELNNGGSAEIRMNLVRNGLNFLAVSYGAGIGPSNYESATDVVGFNCLPTGGIVNPHNFWVEISSQYGLVVFVMFLCWMGCLVSRAWRARRAAILNNDLHVRLAAETVLVGLAGYIFAACENSSYIPQQINWIFLASLLVICTGLPARPGTLPQPKQVA